MSFAVPTTAAELTPALPNPAEPRSAAAIPFRLRPDLVVRQQANPDGARWIVHDPVALTYFQFAPAEWYLLQQLDGCRTPQEILARFHGAYPQQPVTLREFNRFVQRAWSDGLLNACRLGGVGARLGQAGRATQLRIRRAQFTQALAIRLPGINPQPGLAWLVPLCRGMFHPLTFLLVGGFAVVTLVFAASRAGEIAERLPTLGQFFQGEQLLWLAVALIVLKVVHELGHAVACELYGGHCHELGLLLLCGIPCLYCDVSDSWLFPERWRRIMVAAAGMYVELILAMVCFWLWYWTVDGVLHLLALNLVLVASAGTLLANGNPLMKYDGYFIASDWTRIPNLADRARQELRSSLEHFLFWPAAGTTPRPLARGLVAYAAASLVYRILVLCGIAWALQRFLQPQGLGLLVWFVLALMVASLVGPGLGRGGAWRSTILFRQRIRWLHMGLLVGLAAGLIALVGWVPLGFRIRAPLTVEMVRPQLIYAAVAGRLVWSVPPEADVAEGELLARLENDELLRRREQLRRQLAVGRVNLANLERQTQSSAAILEAHLLQAQLGDWEQQLAIVLNELAKCEIRAPAAGRLVATRRPAPPADSRQRTLPTWNGPLFAADNRGCLVEKGTPLCQLSSYGLQAIALVGQEQIDRVQLGAVATIWLNQASPATYAGRVVEVSREPITTLPPQMAAQGLIPARLQSDGGISPRQPTYRVMIQIDSWPTADLGSGGEARIAAPAETLLQAALRWLRQQFRTP